MFFSVPFCFRLSVSEEEAQVSELTVELGLGDLVTKVHKDQEQTGSCFECHVCVAGNCSVGGVGRTWTYSIDFATITSVWHLSKTRRYVEQVGIGSFIS